MEVEWEGRGGQGRKIPGHDSGMGGLGPRGRGGGGGGGGPTKMGLVAMRVTTSMTAWSVQPSLSALRLSAMEPAVATSILMSCTAGGHPLA